MKYALPSPLFCLFPFSVSKATFWEVILPKSCTLDQCGTIHSPQRRQASSKFYPESLATAVAISSVTVTATIPHFSPYGGGGGKRRCKV